MNAVEISLEKKVIKIIRKFRSKVEPARQFARSQFCSLKEVSLQFVGSFKTWIGSS